MSDFCYSCGIPLTNEFKGKVENYCKYCLDDNGNLQPRDTIKGGIAQWIKSWQPDISEIEAAKRAEYYMKAMPAWADRE